MKKNKLFKSFKKNRKFAAVLTGAVITSTLLAACGGPAAKAWPVGLVTSNPGSVLLDTSFSQSAYQGIYDFMSQAYGTVATDAKEASAYKTAAPAASGSASATTGGAAANTNGSAGNTNNAAGGTGGGNAVQYSSSVKLSEGEAEQSNPPAPAPSASAPAAQPEETPTPQAQQGSDANANTSDPKKTGSKASKAPAVDANPIAHDSALTPGTWVNLDLSTDAKEKAFSDLTPTDKAKLNNHNFITQYGQSKDFAYPSPTDTGGSDYSLLTATSSLWKQPATSGISAYNQLMQQGTKIIVAPGFNQASRIQEVYQNSASATEFANTGFILVDKKYDSVESGHVSSVEFAAEQSGFLAALAAGYFLNENVSQFDLVNDKFNVGTFGGMDFSSVSSYMGGFQQGVDYFNKEVVTKIKADTATGSPTWYKNVKELNLVYASDNSFAGNYSGNFDPGKGGDITKLLLAKKVSAIFPVAGPQTPDVVKAINSSSSKTIVIGVDTAQENDTKNVQESGKNFSTNFVGENNHDVVQFSALKNLTTAVKSILSAISLNQALGVTDSIVNGFGGLGYYNVTDYTNGGVGVSQYKKLILPMAKLFNSTLTDSSSEADIYGAFPKAGEAAAGAALTSGAATPTALQSITGQFKVSGDSKQTSKQGEFTPITEPKHEIAVKDDRPAVQEVKEVKDANGKVTTPGVQAEPAVKATVFKNLDFFLKPQANPVADTNKKAVKPE